MSYHDDLEKEVVRQWLYVRVILFRLFRLISSVCLIKTKVTSIFHWHVTL